jgi:hypothetical protein
MADVLSVKQETAPNSREDQMSSPVDDALEWLGRAEQAREVAGLLSDPGAKEAVLQLAAHYERLARAAVDRAERRNLKKVSQTRRFVGAL